MRILIASPYLPWPIDSGGRAAVFSTLKCLENDHQFTLVCPIYDAAGEADAEALRAQLPRVNVRAVFCGTHKERSWVRAAKWVVERGRHLLRPRPSASGGGAQRRKPSYPLDALPEEFILALQEEISEGVDLCQAEFVQMLSLGAWFPKEIPKLFIHHQIHFVYSQRSLEIGGRDTYLDYLDARWHVYEIAYLQQFDGIVTFSEQDRVVLLPWMDPEKVFTSPFPLPADCGVAPDFPERFDGRYLFMASEENVPNRDALEWFLTDIWPEILRELPSARLFVIGKWSESRKLKYSGPGVVFSGFVQDLPATLRGGIMLAPLRIGSGLRVKILAALAQGVPVVSTSIGSEGLLVEDGKELLVRDDKSEFATAAVQLARDPDLWKRLAVAGRVATAKYYSPESVRERRNEIYAALISRHQSTENVLISELPTTLG